MFCTRTTALSLAATLAAGSLTFGQAPAHSAMDPQNSPAAHQGQVGGRPPVDANDTAARAGAMEADQTINAQLMEFAANPEANHDKKVALMAACSNMEEIALSKAILAKSNDSSVKHVAEMMVNDHQMAQDKLTPIAAKLGVKLPASLPAMKQAEVTALNNMSPEMADKAYLSMMKTGHLKTINELADHGPMVKDADLKAWVDQTLPKVRMHAGHVMAAAGAKGLPTDLKIDASDKGM
jgi:putative membrane protein